MDTLVEYERQILSLLVVFSMLGLTVWKLGRRRGSLSLARWSKFLKPKGRSAERMLETVERLVLTPQHALHVIRWRDRELLVATHPQGCTLLESTVDKPSLASRGSAA